MVIYGDLLLCIIALPFCWGLMHHNISQSTGAESDTFFRVLRSPELRDNFGGIEPMN